MMVVPTSVALMRKRQRASLEESGSSCSCVHMRKNEEIWTQQIHEKLQKAAELKPQVELMRLNSYQVSHSVCLLKCFLHHEWTTTLQDYIAYI